MKINILLSRNITNSKKKTKQLILDKKEKEKYYTVA